MSIGWPSCEGRKARERARGRVVITAFDVACSSLTRLDMKPQFPWTYRARVFGYRALRRLATMVSYTDPDKVRTLIMRRINRLAVKVHGPFHPDDTPEARRDRRRQEMSKNTTT